jgi:hypothetical protein
MGRLIKGNRDEGPNYILRKSKNIVQKMDRLDICEFLMAPDYEKEIKLDEEYKFFNLQVTTKILESSKNSSNFIDYWRGHIEGKDKKDKVRTKNLLYPLKSLYIHGNWKEISDEKLTFECNNYNDNYLKLNDKEEVVFSRKLHDLPDSSFKSPDWVIEKLKAVIDQVY